MSPNHSEFVLLALGIMAFVNGDNCFDVDSVVKSDKYMEHQVFRKFWSQSLYTCASECQMSSACLSFGFEKKTRTCLLNSNSSDTANVVDRTGFLFSDIQHWPKSLSGRCARRICPKNSRCHVTRLGLARCVPAKHTVRGSSCAVLRPFYILGSENNWNAIGKSFPLGLGLYDYLCEEFQGCGHPPEVTGANMKYDGHYQGAVATYSCDPDFRACYNNVTSTCQSSGSWESLAGLCGQFRWHNPIMDMYSFPCGPSNNFQLILSGTPTEATKWGIGIQKQPDTLFYAELRLDYTGDRNVVVINTWINGEWGRVLRFYLALAVGKAMEIQITLQDGVYRLLIDGASIHNLAERDSGANPDKLFIGGDASVSKMELMS